MAPVVIYVGKVIDVDQHAGQRVSMTQGAAHFLFNADHYIAPVEQAGQRIVEALGFEASILDHQGFQ